MHSPIVFAQIRQRANLATRKAGHTNLAAVLDEVNVEGIVAVGGNELAEDLVSSFIGSLVRHPAEAFRHAKDVGIDRERREGRTKVYETC